jgi:hypothetical protein
MLPGGPFRHGLKGPGIGGELEFVPVRQLARVLENDRNCGPSSSKWRFRAAGPSARRSQANGVSRRAPVCATPSVPRTNTTDMPIQTVLIACISVCLNQIVRVEADFKSTVQFVNRAGCAAFL